MTAYLFPFALPFSERFLSIEPKKILSYQSKKYCPLTLSTESNFGLQMFRWPTLFVASVSPQQAGVKATGWPAPPSSKLPGAHSFYEQSKKYSPQWKKTSHWCGLLPAGSLQVAESSTPGNEFWRLSSGKDYGFNNGSSGFQWRPEPMHPKWQSLWPEWLSVRSTHGNSPNPMSAEKK